MENTKLIGKISIIGVLVFAASMAIAIVSYPGYNMLDQFMSELGIGPSSIFFNIGLIISGLFLIPFYQAFYSKSKLSKIVAIAGTISGIGLIGVGVFPMDQILPHYTSAIIFFLGSAIAIGFYDFDMFLSGRHRVVCLGEIIISSIIVLHLLVFNNPPMQKLAIFLIILWVVMTLFENEEFGMPHLMHE